MWQEGEEEEEEEVETTHDGSSVRPRCGAITTGVRTAAGCGFMNRALREASSALRHVVWTWLGGVLVFLMFHMSTQEEPTLGSVGPVQRGGEVELPDLLVPVVRTDRWHLGPILEAQGKVQLARRGRRGALVCLEDRLILLWKTAWHARRTPAPAHSAQMPVCYS